MQFNEQPRTFLLLEDSSTPIDLVREILESPLGLAQEIVCKLFNNDFRTLRDDMDVIKEFVAGVSQAKSLNSYSVANYYSLMFSFHQWFHSSYRARQGKVLEAVLRKVLESHTSFKSTPESVKKEMIPMLQEIFKTKNIPNLDIDVMGATPDKKKLIIIQLRSRDDTGGTTAKGSLVDMLKGFLRTQKKPSADILYLIGIWDKRDSQQRESTIKKIYSSLKENTKRSEKEFQKIDKGVALTPEIKLQMSYGIDSILDAIFQWDTAQKSHNAEAVRDVIHKIEKWDDLWLAYAIASIEIEIQALRGTSNIRLLAEKCNEMDIDLDYRSYALLQKSIETAIEKLIPAWTEQTLPVNSPAEQALYIRDLLFLRAIYETKCSYSNNVSTKKGKSVGESAAYYQTGLFKANLPAASSEPELVSFRELIPEITDTTYLTHGIFYYPAKFIPQIPRFCIKEYTSENDWVIDPFAGSGTVGLEAILNKRNAVLMDINPLINQIVPLKIQFHDIDIDKQVLTKLLNEMRQSKVEFTPDWSNLEYWYDKDILSVLSKYWGWVKQQEDSSYLKIIQAALLKASKQFSYAEHKAPKLFKSKTKLAEMESLLQQDWKEMLDELIYKTSFDIYLRAKQLAHNISEHNKTIFYGSVDSSNFILDSGIEAKAIITSPPYLQAQEYIRTSKLELYWLGYSEDEIKKISKLEIPYRKAEKKINTPTLDLLRQTLTRDDLSAMLDSYFYHIIRSLENAAHSLTAKGYLCVFVGNPKVDGLEVETWRIISEYFGKRGFGFLHVYEDQIKNRQLFRNRKNKNPDGMKSEFLLVMEKQ